ncbi:MAG: DUF4136 domain-containing protein [Nitrospirota bacterium]
MNQQTKDTTKQLQMSLLDRQFSKRIYKDPDKDLSTFRTYVCEYTNTNNPLLEKEMFLMLDAVLLRKGMQKNPKNSELTVRMAFQTRDIPVVTPTKYLHHIMIDFLDHAKIEDGKKLGIPPLIYRGEISTAGGSSDIRHSAQEMFDVLLNDGGHRVALYFRRYRIECVSKGETLLVTSTEAKHDWQLNAESLGIHKGDSIRQLGGVAPSRFIENTINGSFPHPIIKSWRFAETVGGKDIPKDNWGFEFDASTVVFRVECPHTGATKDF